MGCEQNCFNEHRLEELEKVVREMKEKHSKRDSIFFERINALETKIVLYNNDLGHIKDAVDEMNDNLKSLMEAPVKRYDTIVVCVITSVIGAIVGFALSGIFPA
nr:MAG TPA: hemolysin [Caudoviricetes sp.]